MLGGSAPGIGSDFRAVSKCKTWPIVAYWTIPAGRPDRPPRIAEEDSKRLESDPPAGAAEILGDVSYGQEEVQSCSFDLWPLPPS